MSERAATVYICDECHVEHVGWRLPVGWTTGTKDRWFFGSHYDSCTVVVTHFCTSCSEARATAASAGEPVSTEESNAG